MDTSPYIDYFMFGNLDLRNISQDHALNTISSVSEVNSALEMDILSRAGVLGILKVGRVVNLLPFRCHSRV